jgi:small subunit ribosomal protein S20
MGTLDTQPALAYHSGQFERRRRLHRRRIRRPRVANTKSAIKKIRVAEKKRARNRPIRTAVRNKVRSAQEAIAGAPAATDTVEAVVSAISQLDRAVSKGVLHANNAARRKSRLMKRLNTAKTSA